MHFSLKQLISSSVTSTKGLAVISKNRFLAYAYNIHLMHGLEGNKKKTKLSSISHFNTRVLKKACFMIRFSDKQHCWSSSANAHVQTSCTS